ncbi:MAG: cyclic nucleotide-binding domain-containing protein [Gemmatimonadota bacterium]
MAALGRGGLLDVRPGEWPRVLALFGHLLLVIATLIILKSVASALFLKRLEPDLLPLLYIGSAVVVSVGISLTTRFIERVPRRALIVGTTLTFAAILGAFWFFTDVAQADVVYPVLYLWVELFVTVMTTQFWTFAGDLFTGRQGRRLFGLVGAGGVVGSILGGGLVTTLATTIGSEELLLVAGGLLLGIPPLVFVATRGGHAPARPHRRAKNERTIRDSVAYFRAHRYPWLLAGIAFATVVATTVIDYQFKILAEEASGTEDSLSRFLGQYNLVAGVLSLLLQLFVTSFLLGRLGVFATVVLMPVVLLLGTGFLLTSPGLLAVFLLKLLDSSLSHSVDLSGKQLLYVPLPERLSGTMLTFVEGVVGRVGLGFAGVLLLPLAFLLGTEKLAWVTLGFLVVWLLLALLVRTEYRQALEVSLHESGFRPVFNPTARLDRTTREQLGRALASGDESQVLVALDFVEETEEDLGPYLRRLLAMRSPEVRARTLRHVAESGGAGALGVILEMLPRLPRSVTAEAVEAIGRLAAHRAAELIARFLGHEDPRVRGAAVRAVLSDGRWDAHDEEALRRFEEMLAGRCGETEACRIEAARTLADPHLAPYRYYLLHYLRDGSLEVQRTAIETAGRTGEREYLPILLEKTLHRDTREVAIAAVAAFGEEALPFFDQAYEQAEGSRRLRKNLVRVVSEIGTRPAANLLLGKLKFASSSERFDLIKALNKIRSRRPDLVLEDGLVRDAIFREAEDYYRNAHYLVRLGAPERQHLLLTSLTERLTFATERVSRLLALIYPAEVIFNIYRGVYGLNVRKAANAHELLDNLIDRPAIKRLVLPLFDDLAPEEVLSAAEDEFAFVSRSVEAVLEEIVQHSARWLKLCALYFAGDERIEALRPLLERTAREDADDEARRTAQLALRLLADEPTARSAEASMDTLVEKVLFLKEVEIFSGLNGEDLTELAGYLRDVRFREGETIFEEESRGDAMFVVRSGRVDVYHSGRLMEGRGPHASLGELSAVDQGPRTFTAVAGTDVEALEIGEIELAEILQENAEISRTMLRVLVGRVRRYLRLELNAVEGQPSVVEPAI